MTPAGVSDSTRSSMYSIGIDRPAVVETSRAKTDGVGWMVGRNSGRKDHDDKATSQSTAVDAFFDAMFEFPNQLNHPEFRTLNAVTSPLSSSLSSPDVHQHDTHLPLDSSHPVEAYLHSSLFPAGTVIMEPTPSWVASAHQNGLSASGASHSLQMTNAQCPHPHLPIFDLFPNTPEAGHDWQTDEHVTSKRQHCDSAYVPELLLQGRPQGEHLHQSMTNSKEIRLWDHNHYPVTQSAVNTTEDADTAHIDVLEPRDSDSHTAAHGVEIVQTAQQSKPASEFLQHNEGAAISKEYHDLRHCMVPAVVSRVARIERRPPLGAAPQDTQAEHKIEVRRTRRMAAEYPHAMRPQKIPRRHKKPPHAALLKTICKFAKKEKKTATSAAPSHPPHTYSHNQ